MRSIRKFAPFEHFPLYYTVTIDREPLGARRGKMKGSGETKAKLVSSTNFNPIALFSLILLVIALILGAVGTGLNQWARLDTDRSFSSGGSADGSTHKTQGLLQRCISYDLSTDILDLQLPSDQLPQSRCINMVDLDCSSTQPLLISALDVLNHDEIRNTNDVGSCNAMKASLQVAAAFMILGVIATFIAVVLYIPFWHWGVYIAGACVAILSVIFLAIGVGVFANINQDYAGFFSVESQPQTGCLSWGFGIVLAAFIINIIATVVGVVAIFYRQIRAFQKSKMH